MSTVLERMIQRTRGPLSSLEPVATPAFVAVPLNEPGWAGPVGDAHPLAGLADLDSVAGAPAGLSGPLGEVVMEEVSEAAPRPEPDLDQSLGGRPAQRAVPRPGRPRARARGHEHGDNLADSSPGPIPGGPAGRVPMTPTPMMSAPVAPAAVTPGPGLPSGPDRTSGRRSTSRGQPAANPHPDEDHRKPGPDPVANADEQPHDVRERGNRTMRAMPVKRPAEENDAGTGQAAAEEPGAFRPTVASPAEAVEPGPVPVRPRPAQVPGQWPTSPSPSTRPGQSAEPVPESGPEITISIGHIEVRSAPAPEKPRSRPPFRPQVSLTDFLSRDRRP